MKYKINIFVVCILVQITSHAEVFDNFSGNDWKQSKGTQGKVYQSKNILQLNSEKGRQWFSAYKTFEIDFDKTPFLVIQVDRVSGKGMVKLFNLNRKTKKPVLSMPRLGLYTVDVRKECGWRGLNKIQVAVYALGFPGSITCKYLKFTNKPPVQKKLTSNRHNKQFELIPLFSSCGYYYKSPALEKPDVYFRAKDQDWQPAFQPEYFAEDKMYRGSIVNLAENTQYDFKLVNDNKIVQAGTFKTWNSNVPIAKNIDITTRLKDGTIIISDKGKPDGWIRFSVPGNSPVKVRNSIIVDGAEYVMLDKLIVRGGERNCINITNSKFIRVRNCDIAAWGPPGTMAKLPRLYYDQHGYLINSHAGIKLTDSIGVVVENCFIHDPVSPSTGWQYGHPVGPVAIQVNRLEQTVIRYNDLIGLDQRRWNDVIESGGNTSYDGAFNRDADIYGNFLAFPHDDGIEVDGGQMNVRVFDNKFEGGLCGISVTAAMTGPSYIFRNLIVNLGDSQGITNVVFKDLESRKKTYGKVHYFNNTTYSDGSGFAGITPARRYGRNNVICVAENPSSVRNGTRQIDFNYNLVWSLKKRDIRKESIGSNSIIQKPRFVNPASGLWALRADSPGAYQGENIPNFSIPESSGKVSMGFLPPGSKLPGPVRPAKFHADRGQIILGDKTRVALVNVKIEDYRGKLEIRKSFNDKWYKVEPASVEVKPGDEISFSASLLPAEMQHSGLFSSAFIIRGENGLSCPVSIYARKAGKNRKMSCPESAVVIPATGCTNGNAKKVEIPDALNGKAVSMSPVKKDNVLTWNYSIPKEGDYYILVRLYVDNNDAVFKHNEFKIRIDDAPYQNLRFRLAAGRWVWCGIPNLKRIKKSQWVRNTMGLFRLSSGKHKISIIPGEQVYMDQILITPDFKLEYDNSNNFSKYTPVELAE